MDERQVAFYRAWAEMLEWMREYAASREGAAFTKESDFPDYIYRMERPYDLPTTIMVASLSDPATGLPVLMANASPRHAVFKEVVLHPYDSHVYRKLTLAPDGSGLAEGRRRFTRDMLFALADDLFGVGEPVAG
ncbi:MAG TPA: NADH-quinone oxidoreductase subunit 15 [Trueperaceae bacterium]|jgi:hypothetical protein